MWVLLICNIICMHVCISLSYLCMCRLMLHTSYCILIVKELGVMMYTVFKNYFTYLQVIPLYIEDYRIATSVCAFWQHWVWYISGYSTCLLKLLRITLIKLPATYVLHKLQLDILIYHSYMYFRCGNELYTTHTQSINVVLQIIIVTCKLTPLL